MELRSQTKVSGTSAQSRATSEGRQREVGDTTRGSLVDKGNTMTAHVNSPSSPTGITRDGKETSRLLPAEGGQFRAVAPQPRSESAGGADTSPEGDPSRRRGQSRESGDADGMAASGRELELAADTNGKHLRLPDEGRTTEFTMVPEVESLTRGSATAPQPRLDVS